MDARAEQSLATIERILAKQGITSALSLHLTRITQALRAADATIAPQAAEIERLRKALALMVATEKLAQDVKKQKGD